MQGMQLNEGVMYSVNRPGAPDMDVVLEILTSRYDILNGVITTFDPAYLYKSAVDEVSRSGAKFEAGFHKPGEEYKQDLEFQDRISSGRLLKFKDSFSQERIFNYFDLEKSGNRESPPVRSIHSRDKFPAYVADVAGRVRKDDRSFILLPTTLQLMSLKEFSEHNGEPLTPDRICSGILTTMEDVIHQIQKDGVSLVLPINTHDGHYGAFNRALFQKTTKLD